VSLPCAALPPVLAGLDPIFESKMEQKDVLREVLQRPWQVQEKAMETDINALLWVEDLEQRVIAADLHLKARNHFACARPFTIAMETSSVKTTFFSTHICLFCFFKAAPQGAVTEADPVTETPMAEFQVTIEPLCETIPRVL